MDQDGWAFDEGDCDDNNPDVNPDVSEICDAVDNNCNGQVDELRTFFYDADQDGFGDDNISSEQCEIPVGYVVAWGDCDADNPESYPGAEDLLGDGLDQDCGGRDGQQPSVGLSASAFESIQDALDAMEPADTVWVGPGHHYGALLDFRGQSGILSSTHGPAETFVSAGDVGPVMQFVQGETADTIVRGLTLEGGTTGVYVERASPRLEQLVIQYNVSGDRGAGLWLEQAQPTLDHCRLLFNQALKGAAIGGGIYMRDSSPSLVNCAILGNEALRGGGVYSDDSSPLVRNCLISGNEALAGVGAGFLVAGTTTPEIVNTAIVFNAPDSLHLVDSTNAPLIEYSVLFNQIGDGHNLDELGDTNLEVQPTFISYSNDWATWNDDYHLAPGSALIDAGDPALADPDGSRSDIGLHGGPGISWDYYEDVDGDGMYGGWERRYLLNATTPNADQDPDGDGLTNLEELYSGTHPTESDSDGDGWDDGNETSSGSDPEDWYSRPGTDSVEARVPEDFATIQAAIDAVRHSGAIRISAGNYRELVKITNKVEVILTGQGSDNTWILAPEKSGPVLHASATNVALSGISLGDGEATDSSVSAGGLVVAQGAAELKDVEVRGCSASNSGGGVRLYYADAVFVDSAIVYNEAGDDGGGMVLEHSTVTLSGTSLTHNGAEWNGGGLFARDSDIVLERGSVYGNTCGTVGDEGGGGAMSIDGGSLRIIDSTLSANTVLGTGNGGALELRDVAFSIENSVLSDNNSEDGRGGAVAMTGSTAASNHVLFRDNRSELGGGALFLEFGTYELSYCIFQGNSSFGEGGGIRMGEQTELDLNHGVLVGNWAGSLQGGGLYANDPAGESRLGVVNSIFAYNAVSNISSSAGVEVDITYSDLYNPPVYPYIRVLPAVLAEEPRFIAYDQYGYPSDLHLSQDSNLVDAGDPESSDVDGSPNDIGCYGGPEGDGWDLDLDGHPDYFWPGELESAPNGFASSAYDCNDLDASVQACPEEE